MAKSPSDPTGDPEIAKMSFEDAMAELETIVTQLEQGRIPLDQAIAVYERGAQLKVHCEKQLADARAKIEKITLGPGGPEGVSPAETD